MSGFIDLKEWVAKNMPELDREFSCKPLSYVRKRLNEITGLDIGGHEAVDDTALTILAALKEMKK